VASVVRAMRDGSCFCCRNMSMSW